MLLLRTTLSITLLLSRERGLGSLPTFFCLSVNAVCVNLRTHTNSIYGTVQSQELALVSGPYCVLFYFFSFYIGRIYIPANSFFKKTSGWYSCGANCVFAAVQRVNHPKVMHFLSVIHTASLTAGSDLQGRIPFQEEDLQSEKEAQSLKASSQ